MHKPHPHLHKCTCTNLHSHGHIYAKRRSPILWKCAMSSFWQSSSGIIPKHCRLLFCYCYCFFYNLGEGLLTLSILLKGLFDLAPSRTIRGSIPDEQIRSIASVHVHETLTPENSKMFRFHLDKFSNLHSSRKRRLWPRLYFDIVSRF